MKKIVHLVFCFLVLLFGTKVNAQLIATVAGNGIAGYVADGGFGFSTKIDTPYGVVVNNKTGNVYFADGKSNRIRMISPCGVISTVAGTGVAGYSGDGAAANLAQINNPTGIALDTAGNIYFSDAGNFCVRKIDIGTGNISLLAGTPGSFISGIGSHGDGGAATADTFSTLSGIVVDTFGNVYVSDLNNNRIREIVKSTGVSVNFVGTGISGATGDGAAATAATLNNPAGLAIDKFGNIYIADASNHRIRIVSAGIITTIAGSNATGGFSGDGGAATSAKLNNPTGVYVDVTGNIFIADQSNNRIRKIVAGNISTISGAASASFYGDQGIATGARLNAPYSVAGSSDGTLYIADMYNNRIRKIFTNHTPTFINGHTQSITMCQNSVLSIDALLPVRDTDGGQILTWSYYKTYGHHGAAQVSFSDTTSGCGVLNTALRTYTPSYGYSGRDTFMIKISDGSSSGALFDTTVVYVNITPLPNAGVISGNSSICPGISSTLSDTVNFIGGVAFWGITNGNASLTNFTDSAAISSVLAGFDTVTYTVIASGCTSKAVKPIVVGPYVSPIVNNGSNNICTGNSVTLKDSIGGGTWVSSNTAIATVAGGIVTSVSPGNVTISYTLTSCGLPLSATKSLTIYLTPNAGTITGTPQVCFATGSTTTLADASPGGVWTSSNGNATVAGGVVTPVTPGIDTISYTINTGFCTSVATVSVLVAPYAGIISGTNNLCTSSPTTFTENVPGGQWQSSNTSIDAIGTFTGINTPILAGSTIISYSISTTCGSNPIITTTINVTVATSPSTPNNIVGKTNGIDSFCLGTNDTLSDATLGGTWSQTPVGIATINAIGSSDSVYIHGTTGGAATISYIITAGNGCISSATKSIYVKPYPIVAPITGSINACASSRFADTLICATQGGIWSSSNTLAATINPIGTIMDTAIVTGITPNFTIISYAVNNQIGTCGTTTVTKIVTVNPLPIAGSIIGASVLCQLSTDTITVAGASSNGSWVRSNSFAGFTFTTADTGVVYGSIAGKDTLGYRVTSAYCGSDTAKITVIVNPRPQKGSIFGSSVVCTGSTLTLKDTLYSPRVVGAGVWKSINTDTATISSVIDSIGIVHGIRVGRDTIRFVVTDLVNGCGSDSLYKVISVDSTPNAGTIYGMSILCTGAVDSLIDTTASVSFGAWSRTNGKASIAATSITTDTIKLSGTTAGLDTIMYKVATSNCGVATATFIVNVNATPHVNAISGPSSLCATTFITLTDPGSVGTANWVSVHTDTATIVSSGSVHGIRAGRDSILFIASSANCGADTAYKVITVLAQPDAGNINGNNNVCVSATDTLFDNVRGPIWKVTTYHTRIDTGATHLIIDTGYSSYHNEAYVVIKGLTPGLDTIQYHIGNTCGQAQATFAVVVNARANAGVIIGRSTLCQNDTLTYRDTLSPGGNWIDGNYSLLDTFYLKPGKFKALLPGIDTILYTVTNICNTDTVHKYITINSLPEAGIITGKTKVCINDTIILSDTIKGGKWVTSNVNAHVDTSGVVKGITSGLDTIKYVYKNACGSDTAKKYIKINDLPSVPSITTHSASLVCQNTMYQNFGANEAQITDTTSFSWSVTNAKLYAIGIPARQYCLVNFTDTGKSSVKLTVYYNASGCHLTDSFNVRVNGADSSPKTTVIYVSPEYFCLDNSATSYQWGYDNIATLDSAALPGEINQNFYHDNTGSDATDDWERLYWVITNYGSGSTMCSQKTYYRVPPSNGVKNVNSLNGLSMDLFPNPTTNEFTIRLNDANSFDKFEVALIDIAGKPIKVQQLNGNVSVMNIANLSTGLYMVVLNVNGVKVITKTIVKN